MIVTNCEIHGVGEITEKLAKVGWDCLKCKEELIRDSRPKPKSKIKVEKFIKKAREVHGDTYDYSLVNYVGAHTKVKILCREHEVFEQQPTSHLSGNGCPACGGIQGGHTLSHTTEKFVKRAREVHGDTYDYSLVEYVNNYTKVKIICREHKVFEQVPASHIKGRGCPACGGKSKQTTEQFVKKAREVHGDTYDYNLVDYVSIFTKVKIFCKEHGEFEQLPVNHINHGSGCPFCGSIEQGKKRSHTTKQFIEKATEVHGEIYDYSLVDYVNSHTKVKIICREHGEFEQLPSNHTSGKGCFICNEAKYLDRPTILYYVRVEDNGMIGYKIGITTKDTMYRYRDDIRAGTHITILDETMYETGKPAFEREQEIIKQYKQYIHPYGEAMLFGGASELFDRDVLNLDKEVA